MTASGRTMFGDPMLFVVGAGEGHRQIYEVTLAGCWTHDPRFSNRRIARIGCPASEVDEQIERWLANGGDIFPPGHPQHRDDRIDSELWPMAYRR